jgi:hypothetical protein
MSLKLYAGDHLAFQPGDRVVLSPTAKLEGLTPIIGKEATVLEQTGAVVQVRWDGAGGITFYHEKSLVLKAKKGTNGS